MVSFQGKHVCCRLQRFLKQMRRDYEMESYAEKYKALKNSIFDKLTYLTERIEKVEDNDSLSGLLIAWRHFHDIIMDADLIDEYREYLRSKR